MTTISKIQQIKRSDLEFEKEIGGGGFSSVYHMRWKQGFLRGFINVAAKKLHRRDIHELEIMSKLDHAHIVKLLGVVDEQMEFMLILELCEGGSLRSYLDKLNGKQLSDEQFFDWAEQAARPLEYLKQKHLVHKDVKSPNYMITAENTLKLGDFGIAKNLVATIGNATERASYQWMPPELLTKGILSPKYDIFALAVVLWELRTGKVPFEGLEWQAVAWKVCQENKRLPIPEDCPEAIKDLIRQCWETDWQRRPDIEEVLLVITTAASAAKEPRQKQIIAGHWKMEREFGNQDGPGKLLWARGMALGLDGNVVIADSKAKQIRIYTIGGEYQHSTDTTRGLKTRQMSKPWQVVISSENMYFLTDLSEHVMMYESSGKFKGQWVSSCPRVSSESPRLKGLAIDRVSNLWVGDCNNCSVNKHRQDGTHLGSIKVGIEPMYIAVTSQDTIVIGHSEKPPQIVSNTGQVMYTLTHPVDDANWNLWGVYCHESIIMISHPRTDNVLCYTQTGKYLGPIPIPDVWPYAGVAMTADCKRLVVCGYDQVRVFTSTKYESIQSK